MVHHHAIHATWKVSLTLKHTCIEFISCRPYVFHDLMMSLPDFVKHFFPDLPLEKSREMLQEILKVNVIKITLDATVCFTFVSRLKYLALADELLSGCTNYYRFDFRLFCTRATLATRRC